MLPRTAPVFVAVLVMLFLGAARAADQGAAGGVRYRDDRMSVDLQRTPLADVIDELGRQSGAAIRGHVRQPRELNLWFDDVPLPDALERVLGEQSFTLRYGPGGRLEAVDLLGEPGPRASSPVPADGRASAGPAAALSARGSVGSAGTATAARGAQAAGLSVSMVGATGSNGPGGAAGSSALLGAGGGGLQTSAQQQASSDDQQLSDAELEQRLRRSLLNSLGAMDDASLAALMDTPEGRRIEALLQYYADHHVGSTRQQQAAGIIDRLPNAPGPAPAPGGPSHHTWR